MDPVADMLVAIKNAYLVNKLQVSVPYSKFKMQICKVLEKEKFVSKIEKSDGKILIELGYGDGYRKMTQIKRVSKLGLRVYVKSKNIKNVKGGKGISIISTPKGVMTDNQARQKKLGGEVICEVW